MVVGQAVHPHLTMTVMTVMMTLPPVLAIMAGRVSPAILLALRIMTLVSRTFPNLSPH